MAYFKVSWKKDLDFSSKRNHLYTLRRVFICNCLAYIFAYIKFSIYWQQWHPTPVLLPGKSHGRRNLVGCSPWGRWESDTTERLHFHFSLSCIGEGHGNPLQCSCLENPRDGGTWWAAVYGVAQSRTRLKRFSSILTFVASLSGILPFQMFRVLWLLGEPFYVCLYSKPSCVCVCVCVCVKQCGRNT